MCSLLSFLFLLLCVHALVIDADLNSDKQALLAFAAALHHGHRLNWEANTSVCSSWIGVKCTADQSHVLAVRLPAKGLFGSIATNTLGKLDSLQVLSLRSNLLIGNLPADISSLPSLRYLYLQQNKLTGNLPALFSSGLIVLDLSYNSFTGKISVGIQKLDRLSVLNMQKNSLIGPIPDLKLSKLKHLNLSYNNLDGSIPSSLQKFPTLSFTGNSLLCGPPLLQCSVVPSPSPIFPPVSNLSAFPPKHKHFAKKIGSWAVIATIAGGLAGFLMLIMLLLLCIFKKKGGKGGGASKEKSSYAGKNVKPKDESTSGVQGAEKNKLTFFEGFLDNFDLEDLLRASAEVLGKGSCGTSYKAVLEDGTMVVVKRLKEVISGKREFEQQMEIIGRLGKHPNVAALRAYYYSKDEKLVVSDFVPNGSFSALLHGNRGSGRTPLDWDTRVKISLEAAHGIKHIHSESNGKFVHGNIKSSNVLVGRNYEACVSDFGLSSLMNFPVTRSRIMVGYRAPEVVETRKFTQKSDVYSFGVMLLEMLTGKSPLQSARQDEILDLPRWVQSVVREEWTSEVFDAELMRFPNIEEEMVQMLQIAMSCVARNPDQRPNINEVINLIEEIRQSNSGNRSASEEKIEDRRQR
ncbi:Non-specific serine/threonine protein kinase protein [Dioscorea alata]|uniref:Non-specific serine/threonine protein kinase protein n=2 Tax=Dioscorea alata TaxID=55571 RepID=A0ACB7U1H6_DIOAL|nr:Non-specific serine/threonine protein kinase protein [Dioscorea alata]KAH7654100.1 Non-specific serine/threonine protein kinase protein [Dioscorea alata]